MSSACDEYLPGTFGRCKNCGKQKRSHSDKLSAELPASPKPKEEEEEGFATKLFRRLSRGSFTSDELPQEAQDAISAANEPAAGDLQQSGIEIPWREWKPAQVVDWLVSKSTVYEQYRRAFEQNHLSGADLEDVDDEMLVGELGVSGR